MKFECIKDFEVNELNNDIFRIEIGEIWYRIDEIKEYDGSNVLDNENGVHEITISDEMLKEHFRETTN